MDGVVKRSDSFDATFAFFEEPENLFLVENKDNKFVFVYVKDFVIHERDCISGESGLSYDLDLLSNAVYPKDTPMEVHLFFDSRIQCKKQARYIFDDSQAFDEFKSNYISPSLVRRKQELSKRRKKLDCLKCGYSHNFSEKETCSNKCPRCSSVFTYFTVQ